MCLLYSPPKKTHYILEGIKCEDKQKAVDSGYPLTGQMIQPLIFEKHQSIHPLYHTVRVT